MALNGCDNLLVFLETMHNYGLLEHGVEAGEVVYADDQFVNQ